jgi:hypothetical protein
MHPVYEMICGLTLPEARKHVNLVPLSLQCGGKLGHVDRDATDGN